MLRAYVCIKENGGVSPLIRMVLVSRLAITAPFRHTHI